MSKKRTRIEFDSHEAVVKLNYFKNEVEFSEDKNFIITVDGTKDDFIISNRLWMSNKHREYPEMKNKLSIDANNERERLTLMQDLIDSFCEKYTLDFSSREDLLELYRRNVEPIPNPAPHVLGTCRVEIKCGEGIFDFIYADFDSVYEKLKNKEYVIKYPDAKGDGQLEKFYNQYAHYCNTLYNYGDLFAASLYTYICPPVFGNQIDHKKTLQYYMLHLKYLQDVYLDLFEFCYDENYHPEVLGGLCPHERYNIYCIMQDLPVSHILKNKHSIVHNKLSGEKMPYGLSEDEINKRFSTEVKMTKELKRFAKDYEFEPEILKTLIQMPHYIHICYDFSTAEEMLNLEFMRLLELDLRFIKCQRCGKYFLRKTEKDARYCDRIQPGTNKTCKDLAAIENFKEKNRDNIPLQIYNLYYKRYVARIQGSSEREREFNEWKYKSSAKRIECEQGVITPYEYDDWNYDYFPNRKGAKFFKDRK